MRNVEASITINASCKEVLQCFTHQEYLNGWWGVERSFIDLKKGGNYVLTWNITPKGFGFVSTGIIAEYDPEEHLFIKDMMYLNPERPILGPMSLEIIIDPAGELSKLYVKQSGYQDGPDWDWYYQEVHDAWPQALISLKGYIESRIGKSRLNE